jgi:hypothetical protein
MTVTILSALIVLQSICVVNANILESKQMNAAYIVAAGHKVGPGMVLYFPDQ